MALRNIVKKGDDVLTKMCRPVEKFDEKLCTLLDDMYETMEAANGRRPCCTGRVGLLRRIVVIDVGEGRIELINPEITNSGEAGRRRGCLSFPGEFAGSRRPMNVQRPCAQNRNGKTFEISGTELLARAFCHEIDHLNGRMLCHARQPHAGAG